MSSSAWAQRALQDLRDLLVVLDDKHADRTVRAFHPIDTRPTNPAKPELLPVPEEAGAGRPASKVVRPEMPPARRRPKSKPAPRKKPRARRSRPSWKEGLPKLEQRHFDVIGLGLVATAIFFAFVVYMDWDGGQAGDAAVDGLRVLIGAE